MMPLYQLTFDIFNGLPVTSLITAILLISISAIAWNYFVDNFRLPGSRTNLAGFIYIVFMSSFSGYLQLHPLVLANFFIILAMNRIFAFSRGNNIFSAVFDSGLFIGLASLFYLPSAMLILLQLIALTIFRPFVWREWLLSTIGMALPWAFTLTTYFVLDSLDYLTNIILPSQLNPGFSDINIKILFDGIIAGIILLLGIFSFPHYMRELGTNTVHVRKSLITLIWFTLIGFTSAWVFYQFSLLSLALLAIPAAVVFSNFYLNTKKKWLAETLVTLWILIIFINNFDLWTP